MVTAILSKHINYVTRSYSSLQRIDPEERFCDHDGYLDVFINRSIHCVCNDPHFISQMLFNSSMIEDCLLLGET